MKKRILIILFLILVLIQFIPALPEDKPLVKGQSFTEVYEVPMEIEHILSTACYDCHSGTVRWPWYSRVAPLSFWIGHHVEEGTEHLDFSNWADYDAGRADHKLEEIAEEVAEGEMPLESYTWMHAEARLTSEQRERLVKFINGLRN